MGIILRNANANVIISASKTENEVNDPIEIELLAIFRGLQLCVPLSLHKLILESDSLLMVRELQAVG